MDHGHPDYYYYYYHYYYYYYYSTTTTTIYFLSLYSRPYWYLLLHTRATQEFERSYPRSHVLAQIHIHLTSTLTILYKPTSVYSSAEWIYAIVLAGHSTSLNGIIITITQISHYTPHLKLFFIYLFNHRIYRGRNHIARVTNIPFIHSFIYPNNMNAFTLSTHSKPFQIHNRKQHHTKLKT